MKGNWSLGAHWELNEMVLMKILMSCRLKNRKFQSHNQVVIFLGLIWGLNLWEISILENEGNEVMCGEEDQNMENSACALEIPREENVQKKNKSSIVFDVLRFLAEKEVEELSSGNKEAGGGGGTAAAYDDDDIGNADLLDVVEIGGIDFPCPRWWPDDDNNKVLSQ
ncbi:uncharacterized protein LOC110271710 [Arachis ipaensis]|uniref:uncharacterized protein LOC110271710 n=1 Tax=Arachis ipaensis TaxID=130454 RepID=UPI000A2B7322|nr:uncharacterized protein LOC110271710 [Arachis ipaensis]